MNLDLNEIFTDNVLVGFTNKLEPLSEDFRVRPRGIWTSELFALYAMSKPFPIEYYVESGVYQGQSLINMRRLLDDDIKVCGFDQNDTNIHLEGISIYKANSLEVMPNFVACLDGQKAVLIDGPKNRDALELATKIIEAQAATEQMEKLSYIAIHDTSKETIIRETLEECFKTWSTDDEEFVKNFSYLDNNRYPEYLPEDGESGRLPYYNIKTKEESKSYGPTLTFILGAK